MNGFDTVTIDDIAVDCNCSHGLFYHYFQSKDQIFNELMRIREERYSRYLLPKEEVLNAGGIKGLEIVCNWCEKLISADDDVIYFSRLSSTEKYTATSFSNFLCGESPYTLIKTLVEEGQKDGTVIDGDSNAIACMFIDFASGATYRRLFEGKTGCEVIPSRLILNMFKK